MQDVLGNERQGAAQAQIVREAVFGGRLRDLVLDAADNRFLALESERGMVWAIDRTSGRATVISGPGVPDNANPLQSPVSLALDAANNRALVATNNSAQHITAVDLTTGARTRIGAYPDFTFSSASSIRVDAARNRLMLLQWGNNRGTTASRIIAQDLTTGQGSFFMAAGIPDNVNNPEQATRMAMDPATGRMWIPSGFFSQAILAIDPNTGARTVLTGGLAYAGHFDLDGANNRLLRCSSTRLEAIDATTGAVTTISGPGLPDNQLPFDHAWDVVLDAAANRALVTDRRGRRVIAVDLATGARSIFWESKSGSGPDIQNPDDLILDAQNNRVLVASRQAVVAVDLATGTRSTISDNTTPNANNPFSRLTSLVLVPGAGYVLAADGGNDTLYRVDLATGARTVLSSNTVPDATNPFSSPQVVFHDAVGARALVIDSSVGAVFAVDLVTGARTVVSSNTVPDSVNTFSEPTAGALDLFNGRLPVGDYGNESILSVDLITGQRTVVSNSSSGGNGPGFYNPFGTGSYDPVTNTAWFSDDSYLSLQSVDVATGDRVLVSGPTNAAPTDPMSGMAGAAWDGQATIYVADRTSGAIVAIDRVTGERVIVSK